MHDLNAFNTAGPNALALEYQRYYGSARRHVHVLDLLDDAAAKRESGVLGLSFEEELGYRIPLQLRALLDDRTNPIMLNVDGCLAFPLKISLRASSLR